MTADDSPSTPSPDEAFAALGDELRLGVLRTLGEADEPLAFSELYDRADVDDSGQFNYHLDKLVGHFVEKREEGYALARPGRRVVEAVLAGAVTDASGFDRTPVDEACRHCGAQIEAEWREGSIALYCTECAGTYRHAYDGTGRGRRADDGYLGRLPLPPAGLADRTAGEAVRAAWTWANLEMLAMSSGICPRCAASVDYDVHVCEDHDAAPAGDEEATTGRDGDADTQGGDGDASDRCTSCHRTHAVTVSVACSNCIFRSGGVASIGLLADTDLLDLQTDHGLNPVAPEALRPVDAVHGNYGEQVHATDPFEGEFTFSVGDDELAVTVDETLDVVDATRE